MKFCKKRVLVYWLWRTFSPGQLLWELLGMFGHLLMSRASATRPYHGIEVAPAPPYKLDATTVIVESLELIRRSDALRFHRVQGHIKRISIGNYRDLGSYGSLGQQCALRILAVPESLRALAIYAYAATIVHESTHAVLDAKRFPHTRVNLKRIERLCIEEEARFLVRFPGIDKKMELIVGFVDGWQGRTLRESSV